MWELSSASDAGAARGVTYDWLNITGALHISATSEDKFTIYVTSLDGSNAAGTTPGFVPGTTYQWIIASGTSVTSFSADKFAINTSAFFNAPDTADFTIAQVGNTVVLNYAAVPEPSAYAVALGGLLGAVIFRRRRRQLSRK